MANEILQLQGTARVWRDTGGDEAMDLTGLATNTGRKGDGHDWGATFARLFHVQVKIDFGTGPTSGTIVSLYWASSIDNSQFDGNLAAGDAAASDTDVHRQLHFVGNIVCDNVTTQQSQSFLFVMPARYGFPVLFNASGQTTGTTSANNTITFTPLIEQVQA